MHSQKLHKKVALSSAKSVSPFLRIAVSRVRVCAMFVSVPCLCLCRVRVCMHAT